jgi:uncharacterized protein (TIGR00730 family)
MIEVRATECGDDTMHDNDRDPRLTSGAAIPTPAHPRLRREPLPWQAPKSLEDDPSAPGRLQAILDSPSYREADLDVAFLNRPESRAVRLQIDYLKPEVALDRLGVRHAVVVFGSTRICERAAAQRRVDAIAAEAAAAPDDAGLARRLDVARRILENSRYYETAREFGRLVGNAGTGPDDCRVMVMTGGGPGVMEAANRGAFDVGARSIGLNIALPHAQFPNPYITPELAFSFHYFALRKLHFLQRACALVVFPGGYGTFDELFETLALIQTRKIAPVPVILVGATFWRRAFDLEFLIAEGVIDDEDRDLFWHAETAQEIWNGLLRWHEVNGTPLFAGSSA